MATLSAEDKTDIARELQVVASWVSGPRRTKVLALAARIEGADADEAHQLAVDAAAALDAPTKRPLGQDVVPGTADRQRAEADAKEQDKKSE